MGYSRKDIYDTSPMALKGVNDNFKYLWFKTFGNLSDADMSENANISGYKIKSRSITGEQIEANSITANEIQSKTITSEEIQANAITADEIDLTTLWVGPGGITLAEDAVISWTQVDDKPFIPLTAAQIGALPVGTYIPPGYSDSQALQAWVASGYKTYMNSSGLYTGSINAVQITAGTITGDRISGGTITGAQLETASNGQRVQIFHSYARGIGPNNYSRWELGGVPGGSSYLSMYAEDGLSMASLIYYNNKMTLGSNSNALELLGSVVTANGWQVLTTQTSMVARFA